MSQSVAKKYARALLELVPPVEYEGLVTAFSELKKLWDENESLRVALKNPSYSLETRRQILLDIAERLRPGDQRFANLLRLIVQNDRLALLPDLAVAVSAMVEEIRKLLALEITSAFELADEEKRNIVADVKRNFGEMASVSWRINREILGGLTARVGDKLLDSSVAGALQRLKSQLMS